MENKGNILAGEEGKRINGSLNQVTAVFGFSLAGMVINDIRLKC
jgi:tRNA A37 threonylcarbamoyladenosine dehydratase